MIAVRLDQDLEERLSRLAAETGRSKSYYVREAIQSYLEDREDHLLGLAVLEREEEYLSLAEVRKELGLDS